MSQLSYVAGVHQEDSPVVEMHDVEQQGGGTELCFCPLDVSRVDQPNLSASAEARMAESGVLLNPVQLQNLSTYKAGEHRAIKQRIEELNEKEMNECSGKLWTDFKDADIQFLENLRKLLSAPARRTVYSASNEDHPPFRVSPSRVAYTGIRPNQNGGGGRSRDSFTNRLFGEFGNCWSSSDCSTLNSKKLIEASLNSINLGNDPQEELVLHKLHAASREEHKTSFDDNTESLLLSLMHLSSNTNKRPDHSPTPFDTTALKLSPHSVIDDEIAEKRSKSNKCTFRSAAEADGLVSTEAIHTLLDLAGLSSLTVDQYADVHHAISGCDTLSMATNSPHTSTVAPSMVGRIPSPGGVMLENAEENTQAISNTVGDLRTDAAGIANWKTADPGHKAVDNINVHKLSVDQPNLTLLTPGGQTPLGSASPQNITPSTTESACGGHADPDGLLSLLVEVAGQGAKPANGENLGSTRFLPRFLSPFRHTNAHDSSRPDNAYATDATNDLCVGLADRSTYRGSSYTLDALPRNYVDLRHYEDAQLMTGVCLSNTTCVQQSASGQPFGSAVHNVNTISDSGPAGTNLPPPPFSMGKTFSYSSLSPTDFLSPIASAHLADISSPLSPTTSPTAMHLQQRRVYIDDRDRMVYVSWIPKKGRAYNSTDKRKMELDLKQKLKDMGLVGLTKVLLFPPKGVHCKLIFDNRSSAAAFMKKYGGENCSAETEAWKADMCKLYDIDMQEKFDKTVVKIEWSQK